MKFKNWIIKHKFISTLLLLTLILSSLLVYDIFKAGETRVRVIEVSERDCNFWERVFDLWPDEDGCKVKQVDEAE